ncbi:hypothetical protein PC129_g18477 [Phytophthora cactorum]|uniref:Uncharacterized protein n=1 Tax=Phytophthora cactorum TaxID=29920 RepID=A0A8T1AZP0_9STRA|nr:hypothetical protein PC111_g19007 [Phytophthora cactorum]KAG2813170.1 hypothetical protein PC112_g14859 [Phytophthora cactorum]KAG2881295.1 hypothetical protein PC114_g21633 [Phytophthora cactorum]KAG2891182.1 hypothetical protein PC115_g19289 [Phytophthora cactorum]KAG2965968.1 hypothetical protein PC118_g19432 [Phytophthora cactorum]
MNLLTTIQNNLLKQLEEEARNYFSRVSDFRCFISDARPGPDVIATLKLRCLSAERLSSGHGTCFIGVDAIQRTASSYAAIEKNMSSMLESMMMLQKAVLCTILLAIHKLSQFLLRYGDPHFIARRSRNRPRASPQQYGSANLSATKRGVVARSEW